MDAVVSNPPTRRWDPTDKEIDPRFSYGIAPKSKADYAFLLHDLYHLRADGIMTIVLPHGVLFRGGEEGQIRSKNLIENHHIQAIIGLPANIFFGTGIPTIVMVLRKNAMTTGCSLLTRRNISSRTARTTSYRLLTSNALSTWCRTTARCPNSAVWCPLTRFAPMITTSTFPGMLIRLKCGDVGCVRFDVRWRSEE